MRKILLEIVEKEYTNRIFPKNKKNSKPNK